MEQFLKNEILLEKNHLNIEVVKQQILFNNNNNNNINEPRLFISGFRFSINNKNIYKKN
jgi:hypothetical protein